MATLCNGIGLGLLCLLLSISVEGYSVTAGNSHHPSPITSLLLIAAHSITKSTRHPDIYQYTAKPDETRLLTVQRLFN
jgi:hypothetical protein